MICYIRNFFSKGKTMRFRIRIYHLLVNRIPEIQKEYHKIRLENPGMSGRIYAWLILLWMNLCWICGNRKLEKQIYYPDMNKCHCNTRDIYRYLNKISMPFIDRMDLCVEAPRIAFEELTGTELGQTSAQIREEVISAHQMQLERYQGSGYRFNSDVKGADMEEYFRVGKTQKKILEDAFERLNLTARSYHKILKVARTAADLEGSQEIETSHILQAICYRNVDRKFWAV